MNPVEAFLMEERSPGLVKTAVDWGNAMAMGVAAPLAAMAAHEGYQEVKGMIGRHRGFKRMMNYNPALKKMPAAKTRAMFNTLHNAAPDLAKDPVVASSFVNRMALADDYVDPRTLADLGSAQQKIQRPGLDFPIGQFTTGMMAEVSDPRHKQFDRQQRAADTAANIAFKEREFSHRKAQDVASAKRDKASDKRARIELAMKRTADKRDKQLFPTRLGEQQAKMDTARVNMDRSLGKLTQQRALHSQELGHREAQHHAGIQRLDAAAQADRARARWYNKV